MTTLRDRIEAAIGKAPHTCECGQAAVVWDDIPAILNEFPSRDDTALQAMKILGDYTDAFKDLMHLTDRGDRAVAGVKAAVAAADAIIELAEGKQP